MSQNSKGQIVNVVDVVNTNHGVSPADDIIAVKGLTIGRLITLPATPNGGDEYTIADVDGSCGVSTPITIVGANGPGQSIQGGAAIQLTVAFAAVKVTYDAASLEWMVSARSGGATSTASALSFLQFVAPTFIVPAGTQFVMIEAVGGGGGGGGGAAGTNGSATAQAGGGGGGSGARSVGIIATAPGRTLNITYGAGGAGGAAGAGGTQGGITSVIDAVTNLGVWAPGGSGGGGGVAAVGGGGGAPVTSLGVSLRGAFGCAGCGGSGSAAASPTVAQGGADNSGFAITASPVGGTGGTGGVTSAGDAGGGGGGGGGAGYGLPGSAATGGNGGNGGNGNSAGAGAAGSAGTAPVASTGAGGGGGGAGGNGSASSGAGGAGAAGAAGWVRITSWSFV